MFAKRYNLKSINTLKNSEKKQLVQRIQNEFPAAAADEKAKDLVPAKSTVTCMKLTLHSEELVGVYVVDGVPIMIERSEGLVPTVCALWKVPQLLPTITIHSPVLSKIANGAPLYLPGVAIPFNGIGFPLFAKGTMLALQTEDNAAACVVGKATMSSADMLLRAGGTCVDVLHFYRDCLCREQKFSKIERPDSGRPNHSQGNVMLNLAMDINQLSMQAAKEEWPMLGKHPANLPAPVLNEPSVILDEQPPKIEDNAELANGDNTVDLDESLDEPKIPEDMDGLLRWCLLTFIKMEGKSIELPIKTSLLYRNYMIPVCPPEKTVDVKKSTYKKMGKFLEAMQREGLIEVKEIEKGVDALVAVSTSHPLVRSHIIPDTVVSQVREGQTEPSEYTPPIVREMYCVTANVAGLFSEYKKGTPLTPTEVRNTVTEYVKNNNLNSTQHKGEVTINTTLSKVTGRPEQEHIKWEALMNMIHDKMTVATEMQFTDGTHKLSKSKLEPIKMQVANRSGNKKVTLVSNLESFGFNLQALSHVCQVGVAASCGVTRTPGAKADQLMLQGDQTYFVARLLVEKYGMPKKFVEGADKALKKKKG